MLPSITSSSAPSTRDKMLWAALAALVVVQIAAFWMLCNDQVSKAQVREAAVKAQRTARADCMYSLGSARCASTMSSSAPPENTVAVNYLR